MNWSKPLIDKYLGCLIGAAAGDALGGPTETRTTAQIKSFFGSEVRTFMDAPNDVFSRGNKAGQVTDDFSFAYITLMTFLKTNGVTKTKAVESLLEWANPKYSYYRMAGPTTQAKIDQLRNPDLNPESNLANDNAKATNGLAMKIAPISLLAKGDVAQALKDTVVIGMPTHNNTIAMAAGGAVASATAMALNKDANLDNIFRAAIDGAHSIIPIAVEAGAHVVAGSNVSRRIEHAINLAKVANSESQGLIDLIDLIGTGILAYESVPTAFGLLALFREKPVEALYAAVNIGNDTDTIATIVGGILGALHGKDLFPNSFLKIINDANQFDLEELAMRIFRWSR